MSKARRPPLPVDFIDYQRLYRVIVTVLNAVNANTAHACKFFSIAGSYILSEIHGLDAKPRFGSAFYRVDDKNDLILAFTDMDAFQRREICSHSEAFHAWIECNGVVIDLLAPLFRENQQAGIHDSLRLIPRKMFQRPLNKMSNSPFDLTREGDFFLTINPTLTNEMTMEFMSKYMNMDLATICKHWYKPSPKLMQSQLEMGCDDGTVTLMKLDKTELIGMW